MDWQYAATAWLVTALGCASADRDQASVKLATEAEQSPLVDADTEIEASADVDATAAIVDLDSRIRDLDARLTASASATIGGGGDSVTAWMYAAIAGAALLYPVIIRPTRRRMRLQTLRRSKAARARRTTHARSPPVAPLA